MRANRRWRGSPGLCALASVFTAIACLPGSGPPLDVYQDDAGLPPPVLFGGDGGPLGDVALGDPFAIASLNPSQGPWSGGTSTTIAGRGFSSKLRVWIGPTELQPSAIFASDPTHVAIVTPPGTPGPADVRVEDTTTAEQRTLHGGFQYDALVVQPNTGATTGGTRISLVGNGTRWTATSTVSLTIGPCSAVSFTDSTHLSCTTPPGAPGSQDIAVGNPDGTVDRALDAFAYTDSPDGYRGGLFGGALAGSLDVLAFDSVLGTPLANGKVIAGGNVATALVGTLDAAGTVHLSDASLMGTVTVTVAAKCHQPITFADVPVSTVTVYLDPELDPSCQGDPPSTGNFIPAAIGQIAGQLVWQGGIELQRAQWSNVPQPKGPHERQAAYVWPATTNPLDTFALPAAASATTPDSAGNAGYGYALAARAGNQTLYALAGLEDRSVSPPKFEPYVMGVVRGVPALPDGMTGGVDIPMTTLLDHAVTTIPQPPSPTQRGPDRLVSTLAIDLGATHFAILPQGTTMTLLPVAGAVSFVGAPALDGTLAGAAYDLTAQAVTKSAGGLPLSIVTSVETTDANNPITIGGFLPIPGFGQPWSGAWTGTHVQFTSSGPVDLNVLDVSSGNGLVTWRIVSPGGHSSFDVPDLTQVSGVVGLVRGPIVATLSVARINQFAYGQVRYGQLKPAAWNAYAQDTVTGSY
jgi:hypothetical protein